MDRNELIAVNITTGRWHNIVDRALRRATKSGDAAAEKVWQAGVGAGRQLSDKHKLLTIRLQTCNNKNEGVKNGVANEWMLNDEQQQQR